MQATVASRTTVATSQTRVVIIWKLTEYVGLSLFLVIVPRMMGPDMYGGFATFLSLIALLAMASGLGALPMFGRFVPEYQVQGENLKTKVLFMQFFVVRVLVTTLLAVGVLSLLPRLLPDITQFTVALGVGALLLGASAMALYQFLYGLKALGKWISYDALFRIILLVGLLMLDGMVSLERAALAVFLTQLCLFLLGLFWTKAFFTFNKALLNLAFLFEHLRFGLLCFLPILLLLAVWRAGEIVVLLFSGQTKEVAFFSVANLVAMTVVGQIGQVATMIVPSLTTLHVSGDKERVDLWLGYSLKYLTIVCFGFLFAVHLLGEWCVTLLWGEEYLPVVSNLKVFALGILAFPLVRTGLSLAILQKQPAKVLPVTAGALVTFLVAAAVLVPPTGSYGASVAVALALGSAGAITCYQFSLATVLAVARFWRHMLIGLLALGSVALPSTPSVASAFLVAGVYVFLLFWSRVVSPKELRRIGQVFLQNNSAFST